MVLLRNTLKHIVEVLIDPQGYIKTKFKKLAIPSGSLGRLEELATLYASIRGDLDCRRRRERISTAGYGTDDTKLYRGWCGYQRPCPACWRRGDRSRLRGCIPFG